MSEGGRLRTWLRGGADLTSSEGRSRERYRRAALATLASVGARLVSTAGLFIAIGLVGSTISGDELGIWLLLVTGIALIGFADLGIGNGLLNVVAEAYGRDDEAAAHEAISSAFFALTAVALGLGALFAAVYPFVSWASVLQVNGPAADQTGPAVAGAVVCTLVSLPLSLAQRVHLARQEGWIANIWVGAGSAVSLCAVAVASWTGASLTVLVVAMLAGLPLAYLVDTIVTFGVLRPALRPSWRAATVTSARRVVLRGVVFFILASAIAVGYESDSVVIAHYLGASAVSTYALPFRLFMLAPTVVQLIVVPLWPAYSEAVARGDLAWVHKSLRRSIAIGLVGTAVPSLLLLPITGPVIDRWVGPSVRPSMALVLAVAAWAVVTGVSAALGAFFNGVGVLRFQVIAASVMAVANVALSVLLVQHVGVEGPVLASVGTQILCILVPSWIIMRGLFRGGASHDALPSWVARWGRPAASTAS